MNEDVRRGMHTQLAAFHRALESGDARAGWKIGFNDPAARGRLGLDATLVGHLLAGRVVPSGGTCRLPAGARGMAEIEIAVLVGRDVRAGCDAATAREAIARLEPALEIVDFSRSFEGVEAILGHDIFHEAAVFGPEGCGRDGASLDEVEAWGAKNGGPLGKGDLGLVPADLGEVVRHVAETLAPFGEGLEAGDRILTGSLVKPVPVEAGDRVEADLGPLGRVEVTLS